MEVKPTWDKIVCNINRGWPKNLKIFQFHSESDRQIQGLSNKFLEVTSIFVKRF
jgi:hypothetical protein